MQSGGQLRRRAPLAIAASLGGLVVQGYYAGHRMLPHFLDQDASGDFGPDDAPCIRMVAIGDSVMTGPGLLDPADLWLRQVIGRLPGYRFELRILARGGAWTRQVRSEQLDRALALRPDIAVVSGGSNDSVRGATLRSIERHLTHIAGSLATVASTVVLSGVGDMGTIPRIPQPLATAVKWRSKYADAVHARVAARHPRVVHLPMWDEGSDAFRARDDLFTHDRFHPNVDGQRVWADTAYPVIAAACARLEGA